MRELRPWLRLFEGRADVLLGLEADGWSAPCEPWECLAGAVLEQLRVLAHHAPDEARLLAVASALYFLAPFGPDAGEPGV